MAELLNRINFSKAMAFFAMDMSDGEIVCKSGFDLVDAEMTTEMFDGTFLLNAQTLDHYLPAIMQVCFGQATAEAALALGEDRRPRHQAPGSDHRLDDQGRARHRAESPARP